MTTREQSMQTSQNVVQYHGGIRAIGVGPVRKGSCSHYRVVAAGQIFTCNTCIVLQVEDKSLPEREGSDH